MWKNGRDVPDPWYMNTWLHLVVMGAVMLTIIAGIWVGKSYFEARAFTRMTGKPASTWDAMFLELRVQEPSKD